MTQVAASGERAQSSGEEIANSMSHGAGLLAAVVAGPVLIMDASQRGGALDVIGASVGHYGRGKLSPASNEGGVR